MKTAHSMAVAPQKKTAHNLVGIPNNAGGTHPVFSHGFGYLLVDAMGFTMGKNLRMVHDQYDSESLIMVKHDGQIRLVMVQNGFCTTWLTYGF